MIKIGNKAPALTGTLGDGAQLALADFKGRWVVIYFYPRDNTAGCTTEAQAFRDLYPTFKRRNTEIIGVSRDSPKSHCNFADKHALPFPLVSDADETWCKAFDVIHDKTLYGKKHRGIVRSTFLIDPEGKVRQQWRGVKVAGHAQAVLDAINA